MGAAAGGLAAPAREVLGGVANPSSLAAIAFEERGDVEASLAALARLLADFEGPARGLSLADLARRAALLGTLLNLLRFHDKEPLPPFPDAVHPSVRTALVQRGVALRPRLADAQLTRELRRFAVFAAAAYGPLLHGAASLSRPKTLDPVGFVCQRTGVAESDVVVAEWESRLHHPGHFVAVSHADRSVVVTVRGTSRVSDLSTDIFTQQVPFLDGCVHQGALYSALQLSPFLLPVVMRELSHHRGYGLVLCGHSLGGAVAALLGAVWVRDRGFRALGASVRSFTFGAPPVASAAVSAQLRESVTAAVLQGDLVPNLSRGSVANLAHMAAWMAFGDELSRVAHRGGPESELDVVLEKARPAWLQSKSRAQIEDEFAEFAELGGTKGLEEWVCRFQRTDPPEAKAAPDHQVLGIDPPRLALTAAEAGQIASLQKMLLKMRASCCHEELSYPIGHVVHVLLTGRQCDAEGRAMRPELHAGLEHALAAGSLRDLGELIPVRAAFLDHNFAAYEAALQGALQGADPPFPSEPHPVGPPPPPPPPPHAPPPAPAPSSPG